MEEYRPRRVLDMFKDLRRQGMPVGHASGLDGIYFVTVTAMVVVWVVALTPLLDWAEIVTL